MKNEKTGLARIFAAFKFSLNGIKRTFHDEAAFRQEVILLIAAIIVACVLDITNGERAILITSVLFVLVVELLNTGIEALADRISEDFDPFIEKAKDAGSAAVLISLIIAAICWAVILI